MIRRLTIALTAVVFAGPMLLGFLGMDPAIGGHGIPFDPTIISGVDASIWFGQEARCMEFTYCTVTLQPWMSQ